MERGKHIIVSCVYRKPGSDIEQFKDKIAVMFEKLSDKIVCGDFNIDLLNPNRNKKIVDFIDEMSSMSLYPMITKPSRITKHQ